MTQHLEESKPANNDGRINNSENGNGTDSIEMQPLKNSSEGNVTENDVFIDESLMELQSIRKSS